MLDDVTISEKNEQCEFVLFIMYAFILLMIHRNANEVHIFNEIFLKRESFCGRLGLLFALESESRDKYKICLHIIFVCKDSTTLALILDMYAAIFIE